MRHQNRHERDQCSEPGEEIEDVPFGIGAVLMHEAHIVDQHQPARRPALNWIVEDITCSGP